MRKKIALDYCVEEREINCTLCHEVGGGEDLALDELLSMSKVGTCSQCWASHALLCE